VITALAATFLIRAGAPALVQVTGGALMPTMTPAKRVPVGGTPYVPARVAFGDAGNRPDAIKSVLVLTLGG